LQIKVGLWYGSASRSTGKFGLELTSMLDNIFPCIFLPSPNRFELRFYMIAKYGEVGKSLRNRKKASSHIAKSKSLLV
jgi:hypothetical protein